MTTLGYLLTPIVSVPLCLAVVLFALLKNQIGVRSNPSIYRWIGSYVFVAALMCLLAFVQYMNGCGFRIGECYSATLADYFWTQKFATLALYYLWVLLALLKLGFILFKKFRCVAVQRIKLDQ